jgi:hypothetical protein
LRKHSRTNCCPRSSQPSQIEPGIVFLGEPMIAKADGWSLGLSLLLRCLKIRELRTWRSSGRGCKQAPLQRGCSQFFSSLAAYGICKASAAVFIVAHNALGTRGMAWEQTDLKPPGPCDSAGAVHLEPSFEIDAANILRAQRHTEPSSTWTHGSIRHSFLYCLCSRLLERAYGITHLISY